MARTFLAQIEAFSEKAKRRAGDIVRQSTQDVIADAQRTTAQGGNMPVDTGFLRNSLVSQLDGREVARGPESYVVAIAGYALGDPMRFGWIADYALLVELGARGRAGRHFAGAAAAKWSSVVRRNAGMVL